MIVNCPKIIQKLPKMPKNAKNCPKIAQNCPKLPKIERLPQQLYFPHCVTWEDNLIIISGDGWSRPLLVIPDLSAFEAVPFVLLPQESHNRLRNCSQAGKTGLQSLT